VHVPGRRPALVAATLLAACAAFAAAGAVTRQQADLFRKKVVAIVAFGAQPRNRQPRRTTVTEDEVNAYLRYGATGEVPAGVVDPTVTILGGGRLAGRAVVDLDAVRKQQNPTSVLDPAMYLSGRLPITATGVLKTTAGVGRFQLEAATIGGVSIPKFLLQQILSYYSRSADQPAGINMDDPFALPAGIREIQVERGQAIIVQ